jgi:hypothetical protein
MGRKLVGTTIVAYVLAGCGTQTIVKTVTVTTAGKATPVAQASTGAARTATAASAAQAGLTSRTHEQPAAPPISLDTSSCANSGYVSVVYVGPNTTCEVGASAYGAYSQALVTPMEGTGRRNPVALSLTPSPNNALSYAIACAPAGPYVSCTGGKGAVVRFPPPNPCLFDHSAFAYCATRSSPYCQMGHCFYPAPASKVCASGWSYQPSQTGSGVSQYGSCDQTLSSQAPASTAPAATPTTSRPTSAEGPGSYSHADDVQFCSTGGHVCIPNFANGNGYVVQCRDGEWSHSGGISGACSDNGGEE